MAWSFGNACVIYFVSGEYEPHGNDIK